MVSDKPVFHSFLNQQYTYIFGNIYIYSIFGIIEMYIVLFIRGKHKY